MTVHVYYTYACWYKQEVYFLPMQGSAKLQIISLLANNTITVIIKYVSLFCMKNVFMQSCKANPSPNLNPNLTPDPALRRAYTGFYPDAVSGSVLSWSFSETSSTIGSDAQHRNRTVWELSWIEFTLISPIITFTFKAMSYYIKLQPEEVCRNAGSTALKAFLDGTLVRNQI